MRQASQPASRQGGLPAAGALPCREHACTPPRYPPADSALPARCGLPRGVRADYVQRYAKAEDVAGLEEGKKDDSMSDDNASGAVLHPLVPFPSRSHTFCSGFTGRAPWGACDE